jgi:c-di-GMP-binding flagellar brake protein YcgR
MNTAAPHNAHQLKVWEKVEIVVGEEDQAGHYLARVQDFLNGGIVVTEPEFLHGNSLLTENAAVKVIVTREDAVYQFRSAIKRTLSRARRQYLLNPPRHIERVQRRLFVRVELTTPMSWAKTVPIAEWQTIDDRSRWIQTVTVDMSGGGILFRTTELVERQSRLLLKVSLLSEIGLTETVAAICMRGFTHKDEHYCGAAFILAEQLRRHFSAEELKSLPAEISQFDINSQNRLVSHIFQLQISLRRRGLI